MTTDWYYLCNGQMVGPLTAQDIRGQALAGQITAETPVRRGMEGNWTLAKKVKGLCDSQPRILPPESPAVVVIQPAPSPSLNALRPVTKQQQIGKIYIVALASVLVIFMIVAIATQYNSTHPEILNTSTAPTHSKSGPDSSQRPSMSKLTKDNYLRIVAGMEQSDVRLILGPPHDRLESSTEVWKWNEGKVKIRVRFTSISPYVVETKWEEGLS